MRDWAEGKNERPVNRDDSGGVNDASTETLGFAFNAEILRETF